jgi:hypothetical protein
MFGWLWGALSRTSSDGPGVNIPMVTVCDALACSRLPHRRPATDILLLGRIRGACAH